jgi:hypothetical protein
MSKSGAVSGEIVSPASSNQSGKIYHGPVNFQDYRSFVAVRCRLRPDLNI